MDVNSYQLCSDFQPYGQWVPLIPLHCSRVNCMYTLLSLASSLKSIFSEFLSWLSSNKLSQYPEGCGFGPWPRSVGEGPGVAMSCAVGHRCGSDPALLWLWCRLAAAALIGPLAWELPYATGAALKKNKKICFIKMGSSMIENNRKCLAFQRKKRNYSKSSLIANK